MVEESIQKYWRLTQNELAVRVQEWERINARALSAVNRGDRHVEMVYLLREGDSLLHRELEGLVTAEQDCCGAAGIKFELTTFSDSYRINIRVVREGLPSHTVIAAFAAMSPS